MKSTKKDTTEKPKKFTIADFKKAGRMLFKLDLADVYSVIETGIPLNEEKFEWSPSMGRSTALELITSAIIYTYGGPDRRKEADQIALILIENGANPLLNPYFAHSVMRCNMLNTFNYMLEHGYEVNNASNSNEPVLSSTFQNYEAMEYLLDKGADPNLVKDILHDVAMFGPLHILKRLVEDYKLPLDTLSKRDKKTALQALKDYCNTVVDNNLPIAHKQALDPKWKDHKDNTGKTPAESIKFYEERYKNLEYLEEVCK